MIPEYFLSVLLSAPADLPKNDYQAKVGKELPKQFPEPLLVGKLDVGNFHSHILQRHWKPGITNNKFREGQSR